MAAAAWLANLRPTMEEAIEIVPPHWVDDAELIALEERFDPLTFERFEDGTLLVSPPTGGNGSRRSLRLASAVMRWCDATGAGVAFGPDGGFRFPSKALLAPDATFVESTRWASLSTAEREGFPPIVPDAAFEMISKTDRIASTRRKVTEYLRAGVRLVVVIDPYQRRTHVGHGGEAAVRDLGDIATLDCAPVMPGLLLDIARIIETDRRR